VFLGYLAISVAYFGVRVLPHPGRLLVGSFNQSDAEIYLWCFAWWPHAILHWTNPFVSHVVYAPTGIDLAWVTSIPGLAIVFAPLTLLFGPDVSFNIAALLMPALTAWTAFLLCRYLTRSTVAGIFGGYLFGFSSYMLAHEFASHINLTSVFLIPLAALVMIRFVRGELDGRGLAWRFALIVAGEGYISTEVALTMTMALVLALLLTLPLPSYRRRAVESVAPLVGGYALAALICLPLVYYTVTHPAPNYNYADSYGADLLNLFVPTHLVGWGGSTFNNLSAKFPGDDAERDSYLGIPILLVFALYVWRRRRERLAWSLVAFFGIATLISLGTALYVGGHRVLGWLPWSVPAGWTNVDFLPSRFALYATLVASVVAAMWFASTKGRVFGRPYVLPVLAVATLIPAVWKADYRYHPFRPAFFAQGTYKVCIPKGETLLIFPFGHWGDSDIWQAESNFWFKIAEGSLGHSDQPASFLADPTNAGLTIYGQLPGHPTIDQVLALTKRRRIDRVISVDGSGWPDFHDLETFGLTQDVGGVSVSPACGHESLAGDKRVPPNS